MKAISVTVTQLSRGQILNDFKLQNRYFKFGIIRITVRISHFMPRNLPQIANLSHVDKKRLVWHGARLNEPTGREPRHKEQREEE